MREHDETPGSPAPRRIAAFLRDESGATAIEYGLIAALIILVIVAGIGTAGTGVAARWATMAATAVGAMSNAQ